MFINNSKIGSWMTTSHAFTGIRRIDRMCKPVQWDLSIQLATMELEDIPIETQTIAATVAYQKLIFWLETQLPDIIIAEAADEEIDAIIFSSDNNFMYCPSAPSDDVLVQLFHAKIQSILGDNIFVGDLTMKSSDTMSSYSYNSVSPYQLPETKDYILDPMNDIPWWFRSTMDTVDLSNPDEGDEVVEFPEDALIMLERNMIAAMNNSFTEEEEDTVETKSAEVVSINDYTKPTLVK